MAPRSDAAGRLPVTAVKVAAGSDAQNNTQEAAHRRFRGHGTRTELRGTPTPAARRALIHVVVPPKCARQIHSQASGRLMRSGHSLFDAVSVAHLYRHHKAQTALRCTRYCLASTNWLDQTTSTQAPTQGHQSRATLHRLFII